MSRFLTTSGRRLRNLGVVVVGAAMLAGGLALIQSSPAGADVPLRCVDTPALLPIAAGSNTNYALGKDGSEWSWGDNSRGQVGNGTTGSVPYPVNSSGFSAVQAVAAGSKHALVLRQDGTVWAWGDNTSGQLGRGFTSAFEPKAEQVNGLGKVVAISAGGDDSYAVTESGAVYGWGSNVYGQVGDGTTQTRTVPTYVNFGIQKIKQIATDPGGNHTLALTTQNNVFAWGNASMGSNGPNAVLTGQTLSPVVVPKGTLTPIAVAAGYNHSALLDQSGKVYAWGSNVYYQLGTGATDVNSHPNPQLVPTSSLGTGVTIQQISAGLYFTLAKASNGKVYGWGDNYYGQMGNGSSSAYAPSITQTQTVSSPAAVAAGSYGGMSVTTAGQIFTWGANNAGQIGNGTTSSTATPQQLPVAITLTQSTPKVPQELSAEPGDGVVYLRWKQPTSVVTQYVIQPYLNGTAQTPQTAPSGSKEFVVKSLSPGQSYTFEVSAQNCLGTGTVTSKSDAVIPRNTEGNSPDATLETSRITDRMSMHVNLFNGNLTVTNRDLTLPGTGLGLTVERSYNNLGASVAGSVVGRNWTMTGFSEGQQTLSPDQSVVITMPTGAQVGFAKKSDGTFVSPSGVDATLTSSGSTYVLTEKASGDRWTYAQGTTGPLLSRQDRNGNTITFDRGSGTDGTTATAVDTKSHTTNFKYGPSGRFAEFTDPINQKGSYTFDATTGNLTKFVDQKGNATGTGGTTNYTYDTAGNLTQITTPAGRVVTFDYEPTTRRLTAIHHPNDPANPTTTFTYTTNADNTHTTVETDANHNATTYVFDPIGRVLSNTDALNNAQSLTYTSNSNVATYSAGNGSSSGNFGYDTSNNRTLSYSQPGAHSTALYDDAAHPSLPTSVTDPQNNTSTYTYDANGNLASIVDPLPSNNETDIVANSDGTLASVTDAAKNKTTYEYDADHNLKRVVPPLPLKPTSATYDGLSRLKTTTDGKGITTTLTYDALDRVVDASISGTSQEATVYDDDGNATSVTNQGGVATMTYDALGRLTQRQTQHYSLITTVTYTYDGVGNLATLTDNGGTTTYHYDAANRPDKVTDSTGRVTTFGYDANGNRTSTDNGRGLITTALYDGANRLINKRTYSNGAVIADRNVSFTPSGPSSGSARQITRRGDPSVFASNANFTSFVALAKPAGLANGDVEIAQVVTAGHINVTTVPTGWTLIRTDSSGTTSSDVATRVYQHVVSSAGSEPAVYNWAISTSARAAGGLTAWTGVDPVNPIKSSGGSNSGSTASTSWTAPAADYVNGELSLLSYAGRPTGATAAITTPDKYTNAYDTQSDLLTAAMSTRSLGATPGTVAAKTTTGPNGTWAGQHVLLRPLYDSSVAQLTPTGTKTYDALNRLTTTGAGETYTYDAMSNRTSASNATQTVSEESNNANQLTARHKPGVYRAAATALGTVGATSISINVPAGTKPGDVLIAQLAANPTGSMTQGGTVSPSETGWHTIDDTINTVHTVLYWRVAGASDPTSYGWTFDAPNYVIGAIAAYGGIDTTNPIDKSGSAIGASTTATSPSVTTTEVNDQIASFVSSATTSNFSPPSGMTQRWQVGSGASPPGSISLADQLAATKSATGSKTSTASSSGAWVAQTVALRATTGYAYDENGNFAASSDGTTITYEPNSDRSGLIHSYNGAPDITVAYRSLDQTEVESVIPATRQSAACAQIADCSGLSTTIGGSAFAINSILGMTAENVAGAYTYYVRDPAGNLISARTATGTYYYVTDADESVTSIVDSSGATVATYAYDSWGRTIQMSGAAIAISNPWRYRSGYQDGSGLYHFGARFYDPVLARWTQADPAQNQLDPTQWNAYSYAGDDPVNFSDPTGLISLADVGRGLVTLGKGIEKVKNAVGHALKNTFVCAGKVAIALANPFPELGNAITAVGLSVAKLGGVLRAMGDPAVMGEAFVPESAAALGLTGTTVATAGAAVIVVGLVVLAKEEC